MYAVLTVRPYEQRTYASAGEVVWNDSDAFIVIPISMRKWGPSLADHPRVPKWEASARIIWHSKEECVLESTLIFHVRSDGSCEVIFAPEPLFGIVEFQGAMYINGPCESLDSRRLCWKIHDDQLSKIVSDDAQKIENETRLRSSVTRSEYRANSGYSEASLWRWDFGGKGDGPTFKLADNIFSIKWEERNNTIVFMLHHNKGTKQLVVIPQFFFVTGNKSLVDPIPSLELFGVTRRSS